MYALPRALAAQNCDVKVILPRYKCIPQQYQDKMVYRGAFRMDLCADGRSYYVGIMEYVWDGVVYDCAFTTGGWAIPTSVRAYTRSSTAEAGGETTGLAASAFPRYNKQNLQRGSRISYGMV